MQAMLLERAGQPFRHASVIQPTTGPGEVTLRVSACGVCRTDLHMVDGDLVGPKLPLVLGHEIVGTVAEVAPRAASGRPRARRRGSPSDKAIAVAKDLRFAFISASSCSEQLVSCSTCMRKQSKEAV
jgi:hypothetical protein